MTDIVNAVTRVTDIMGEIASASDEQSRGIDQVALAVSEMDRVTQQNASLVQESAAAAAALEEQASRLTRRYRLSAWHRDRWWQINLICVYQWTLSPAIRRGP